ncbi:hypothetical protein SDC9_72586 [bioreactor metagenome]|uniref:Uncharacterized protein n=1 Tax=bioreactor metagenome TaxID=1076179 RepID=A0A644YC10_9ZZZZ
MIAAGTCMTGLFGFLKIRQAVSGRLRERENLKKADAAALRVSGCG